MAIAKTDVLRLYKNLLLYSKTLRYTDPVFFKRRIVTEFKKNKELADSEDINFAYKKGEALLKRSTIV